jgi:hypothetical protein
MGVVLVARLAAQAACGVGDHNHVHGDPKHLRDQLREALRSPAGEALLDDDVLTLNPAELAQALDECVPHPVA